MQIATVKWIAEQKFLAISPSGHAITIDSDRTTNHAPGPMELLLLALGACTATDLVIVLEKKRQKSSPSKFSVPANAPPAPRRSGPSSKSSTSSAAVSTKPPSNTPSSSVRTNTAPSPPCSKKPPPSPGVTKSSLRSHDRPAAAGPLQTAISQTHSPPLLPRWTLVGIPSKIALPPSQFTLGIPTKVQRGSSGGECVWEIAVCNG